MKNFFLVFAVAVILCSFLLAGCVKLGQEQQGLPGQAANESKPQAGGQTSGQAGPAAEIGGWDKNFGGPKDDQGVWITEAADSSYLVVGYSNSYTEYYDIYLLKIEPDGNEAWHKTIGDKYNEIAFSAIMARDGSIVIAGTSNSYDPEWASGDAYLLKLDQNGNEIWHRNFAQVPGTEETANSVIETKDGSYLVLGTVNTYDSDRWTDVLAIKTDSNGNAEWLNTYGGEKYDQGYSAIETEDGYVIAGMRGVEDRQYDIYVIKIGREGNLIWEKTYGTNEYDEAFSITEAYDGGYLIAGRINNGEPFVMKLSTDGEEVWTKKYPAGGFAAFKHITKTSDGNYTLAGVFVNGSLLDEVYLLKINASGDIKWSQTHGMISAIGRDYGEHVAEASDGGLLAVGTTESKGSPDVYVIRVYGNKGSEYK